MKFLPNTDVAEASQFLLRRPWQTFRVAVAVSVLSVMMFAFLHARADITRPDDAPKPLAPEESVKRFHVPDGFEMKLVAAEPLVRQPTGVCWDAKGRLYICELHGYNMEGQLDVEELNKTGKLDMEVRRIQASDEIKEAAKKLMYGTVKNLVDTDGDGRMDKAHVLADRLPPCYGVCPARDGVIVACAPDILFLADRDGDGEAEVREVLYTGFAVGGLERAINCPQWGLDDWIYFGRGHDGGTITGPHLKAPVVLPNTDFRIKADGTAIEPILGATKTIGFAFTDRGERLVTTTVAPAIQIAPFPWHYLARNPDFSPGKLDIQIGDTRTYPTSQPHPWRTKRAEDPEFYKYYNKRYGAAESVANGYFTSCCSPLVYQSDALPGLNGQYLACEPAQNMVYRGIIERNGPELQLVRAPGEEQAEFLTSTDQWFNPVYLAHAPDGSIAICDFYREIIEDYSAVPRYLQQQYGLKNGNDHGRIWRLTHRDAPAAPPADMSGLTPEQLADEVASPNYWRRQTAKRLLSEQKHVNVAPRIARLVSPEQSPAAVINTLYTLDALDQLSAEVVLSALASSYVGVRIHALRLSEPWLAREPRVIDQVLTMIADPDETVLLQLALTLGESSDPRALEVLAKLAREHGDIRWMDVAILSSLSGRAGNLLETLLAEKGDLGQAYRLLKPLASIVAAGRNSQEISKLLENLGSHHEHFVKLACLRGLSARRVTPLQLSLSDAAIAALKSLTESPERDIASQARVLTRWLRVESSSDRKVRIERHLATIADIQLSADQRLAALGEIAFENDPQVTQGLLKVAADATPKVREAILEAVFSRRERLADVVAALEAGALARSALSAVQRSALIEHPEPKLRARAGKLFASTTSDNAALLADYRAALKNARDIARGEVLFRKHCATCHQAHGIGSAVGPDLTAESKRAEETLIQDILSPSASITAGYGTYTITTKDGEVITGLLAAESASDITLKQQEGKTQTIFRKDIDEIRSNPVSLMPDNLTGTLSPQDVADLLAWLRSASGPGESQAMK